MANQKPFILFITGASTTGKTTLFEALKKDPQYKGNVEFHDIDENGVPKYGRGYWRPYRVEELLGEGMEKMKDGISTIAVGIVKPQEIFDSYLFKAGMNVHFLLIQNSRQDLRKRLQERLAKLKNQGPDVKLGRLFKGNVELDLSLTNAISVLKNAQILSSSKLSKAELLEASKRYIEEISSK